jgi:hypothetical protein
MLPTSNYFLGAALFEAKKGASSDAPFFAQTKKAPKGPLFVRSLKVSFL